MATRKKKAAPKPVDEVKVEAKVEEAPVVETKPVVEAVVEAAPAVEPVAEAAPVVAEEPKVEDFILPVRDPSRGTEVTELPKEEPKAEAGYVEIFVDGAVVFGDIEKHRGGKTFVVNVDGAFHTATLVAGVPSVEGEMRITGVFGDKNVAIAKLAGRLAFDFLSTKYTWKIEGKKLVLELA